MKPELKDLLAAEAGADVLLMAELLHDEPDTEAAALPLLFKGKEYTVTVTRAEEDDDE